MKKSAQIDNNRVFEFSFKTANSIADLNWPNSSLNYYSSGRGALFSLLSSPLYSSKPDNKVLLPAFLPEGIIYPFKRNNWEITFYNLDLNGDPIWNDIPKQEFFDIAIIIHLFGYRKDVQKFKSLLSIKTLIIEDFAHSLPSSNIDPKSILGDILLFSLPKIIGLPDGAILISKNQLDLPKPYSFSIKHAIYINFSLASICFHSLFEKWPISFGKKSIKYLGVLSYIIAYKILMQYCHQAHKISATSKYLFSKTNLIAIEKKRLQLAKIYSQRLNNPHIHFDPSPSSLTQIGFPIFCKERAALITHLNQAGIAPTIFSEGWNFIPADSGELFKSSQHLLNRHVLLPLHHKLSTSQIERITQAVNDFTP